MPHTVLQQIKQQRRQSRVRIAGLTLLELITVIAVLAIIATVAVPSYSSMMERNRTVRLVDEVHGFLLQAKSEAVMRNQTLKIDFIMDATPAVSTAYKGGDWVLALLPESSAVTTITGAQHDAVALLMGSAHEGTTIKVSKLSTKIDPVRGAFSSPVTFESYVQPTKIVEVQAKSLSGRIQRCSPAGEYGYASC